MKEWLLSDIYKKYLTPEVKKKADQYLARHWHYYLKTVRKKGKLEVKYILSTKHIYKPKELLKRRLL